MSAWKYTDPTKRVVFRINADGSSESCMVSAIADWLAAGNTPQPADPLPDPAIAAALAELTALDLKSIRSMREYIASRLDAPAILKGYESEAITTRGTLNK